MVSRSAPARGMRLEATPRACGLRLLTVLAATKLLQWKKCFRCSFEKNASMRESGGGRGDICRSPTYQILPRSSLNMLRSANWMNRRFRSSRRRTGHVKIMSMSTTTFFKRNCHSTPIYRRQPIFVRSAVQSLASQRYDRIPLIGKIRSTHFAEKNPRAR